MISNKTCLILIIFLAKLVSSQSGSKVFMCYFEADSTQRTPENYKFHPNKIDLNLCTHLIYGFAGVSDKGRIYSMNPVIDFVDGHCDYDGTGEDQICGRDGMINATISLKTIKPSLKVLISIRGDDKDSHRRFKAMLHDTETRTGFIQSVITFINTHAFDGVDIHWKYPDEDDKNNFTVLLRELRVALNDAQSGIRLLTLTAAVAGQIDIAEKAYNISEITRHLNYINLMAYDLKSYDNTHLLGHHSSLLPDDEDLTVANTTEYYISKGAAASKLVLGIAAFGNTFKPTNSLNIHINADADGPGDLEPVSNTTGKIFYNEICEVGISWKYYFDLNYMIPYLNGTGSNNTNIWVGFDDEMSVIAKVDYAEKMRLGGMMVWSLDKDDFNNLCGGWYSYAIAGTIKQRMDFHESNRDK